MEKKNDFWAICTRSRVKKIGENINIIYIPALKNPGIKAIEIINFSRFSISVLLKSRHFNFDVVLASTSKMLTGLLGYFVSKRTEGSILVLDIRDIFIENMRHIYGKKFTLFSIILKKLERMMFDEAKYINLISPGFEYYFFEILKNKNVSYLTHGVDEKFAGYDFNSTAHAYFNPDCRKIVGLYSGNIGAGQKLESIIPKLASLTKDKCRWKVIGRGNKKPDLKEIVDRLADCEIEILDPVNRNDLMSIYDGADFLFLHLAKVQCFEYAIPSKIYEYAATGKPILAGVSGWVRKYFEKKIEGIFCFDPENPIEGMKAFERMEMGKSFYNRDSFMHEFDRKKLDECFWNRVFKIVN